MFKLFSEPREVIHEWVIKDRYPNCAYIISNFKIDKEKIKGTITGELYAVSDDKPVDLKRLRDLQCKLINDGIMIHTGNTFPME